MRQRLATWALRTGRWRIAGELPPARKYLIILSPHTSNWDFVLGLLAGAAFGIRPSWLGKAAIFRWPFVGLLRRLGGIPVHRERSEGVVRQVAEAFAATDALVLGIAPEGTRSPTPYWKSGFYHIAIAAGVPIVPAYIHRPTRTIGLGPALSLSGQVQRDMEEIRTFYAGFRGVRPANAGRIKLREEEQAG